MNYKVFYIYLYHFQNGYYYKYKYYFYLQDYNAILPQLQNSAVHLKNINSDYINLYFETLLDAKERKTQAAMNRVRKNLTVLIF